jgi:hypothetical protein
VRIIFGKRKNKTDHLKLLFKFQKDISQNTNMQALMTVMLINGKVNNTAAFTKKGKVMN